MAAPEEEEEEVIAKREDHEPALLQMTETRILPCLVQQKLDLVMLSMKEKLLFGDCLEAANVPGWTRLDSGEIEG